MHFFVFVGKERQKANNGPDVTSSEFYILIVIMIMMTMTLCSAFLFKSADSGSNCQAIGSHLCNSKDVWNIYNRHPMALN